MNRPFSAAAAARASSSGRAPSLAPPRASAPRSVRSACAGAGRWSSRPRRSRFRRRRRPLPPASRGRSPCARTGGRRRESRQRWWAARSCRGRGCSGTWGLFSECSGRQQALRRNAPARGASIPGMIPCSILDLSPIVEGGDAAQALRCSLDLARLAERLGYRRFWVAEHHGMPGVASAATAVVIAHVAGGTRTIRVGAGGIMLPNHAPLVVAEQFGTLESLFPGRIDLGLGRAPGTDPRTAHALRRNLDAGADNFPQDVVELMGYFQPAEEGQ